MVFNRRPRETGDVSINSNDGISKEAEAELIRQAQEEAQEAADRRIRGTRRQN